jgi:hypothetical protein
VTYAALVRQRRRLVFFVGGAIAVFSATTVGLHILVAAGPLWMAGIIAVIPTLIVARAAFTVAERRGWLGGVIENPEGSDDCDPTGMAPRWIPWVRQRDHACDRFR